MGAVGALTLNRSHTNCGIEPIFRGASHLRY